jgi:hypothetical protein
MLKVTLLTLTLLIGLASAALGGLGSRRDCNLSDPNVYQKLEKFSMLGLEEIANKRNAKAALANTNNNQQQRPLSYSLLKILSAQSQVVSGVNYYIDVMMKEASCGSSCTNEACTLTIWDRPWLNSTLMTNFTCQNQVSQLGSMQKISVKDAKALKALDFAVSKMNKESNEINYHKPSVIHNIYKQVVNGIKYVFVFKYAPTNCEKHDDLSIFAAEDCTIEKNASVRNCKLIVFDQPWQEKSASRYEIKNVNCF